MSTSSPSLCNCFLIVLAINLIATPIESQLRQQFPASYRDIPNSFQQFVTPTWRPADLILPNYNNQQAPTINGTPVAVEVSLSVLSFRNFNEADQSFKMDVFIHQRWNDFRIQIPRGHDPRVPIVLDSRFVGRLWTPSVNFRNARSSSVSQVIQPSIYMTINGTQVFLAAKLSVELNCDMDFWDYPFDTQDCYIEMASLSNTIDVVALRWGKFYLTKNLNLPQFHVEADENAASRDVHKYDIGTFYSLKAKFRVIRNVGNFIISRYIPSFLIVLLTFTGFWIPTSAYPARVGLVITGLLSLITQQYQAPLNVSYVYALNVWMMICIIFVFGELIEYSIAISDWPEKRKTRTKSGSYTVTRSPTPVRGVNSSNGSNGQSNGNGNSNNSTNSVTVNGNTFNGPATYLEQGSNPLDEYVLNGKKYVSNCTDSILRPNSRNNIVDMFARVAFPGSFFTVTFIYILIYCV